MKIDISINISANGQQFGVDMHQHDLEDLEADLAVAAKLIRKNMAAKDLEHGQAI